MLAIRMQRTGRKGHAMFRMVVQDSRQTPTSGKVVAQLGHYDPHTKTVSIDKEKATTFLSNGAQPSDRVARLLKKEGVKLPDWVTLATEDRARTTRNAEKLRKNQPKEEKIEEEVRETADEPADAPVADTTADEPTESTDNPAETEATEDAPAEEVATDETPASDEKPAA